MLLLIRYVPLFLQSIPFISPFLPRRSPEPLNIRNIHPSRFLYNQTLPTSYLLTYPSTHTHYTSTN